MISLILIIILVPLVAWLYFSKYEYSRENDYRVSNKTLLSIAIVPLIAITLSCFTMISPGTVGIVVNLFGSAKGVENSELSVGMHFIEPWKTIYTFPVYEQNHQWIGENGFSFQTAEGLSVKANIGINFHLEPSKVPILFAKYRQGMEEITHIFIKNNIRDAVNKAASKMRIEDLYGSKKEEFFKVVHENVKEELAPIGFHISHIFIIGQFIVPDLVMEALNRKIEAVQRAEQRENELREAEAQARKEIAMVEGAAKSKIIAAKAEAESLLIDATSKAKANSMIAESLGSDLLKYLTINKWDGKLPQAMSGEGSTFLIDLKSTR